MIKGFLATPNQPYQHRIRVRCARSLLFAVPFIEVPFAD